MISTILNYTFNASARTITLTDYGGIQLERFVLIKNLTTNQWIYKVIDTTNYGASVSGNQITFNTSSSGMANGDKLLIKYDAPTSLDTQAVSGTFFQATQPVSIAATVNVAGTFWQSIQPVSLASLPSLPTGTNTIGSIKVTDGTNTAAVLNSAPGSDTGQPALAVRIISQLGAGVGGGSTQYVNGVANASPTGTLALGFDGANLRALKSDNAGILSVNFTNSTIGVTGTFWQATQPISGTVAISNFPASQAVTGTFWQATQPVSGTVTANIGTTNGLALDATLTGGTQKAILRGGVKGSTTAADVTSISVDVNTQALHVNVTNFPGTQTISGTVSVSNFPASQAVTGTFWQATQPVSLASLPALVAGSAIIGKVGIDQTTNGTTNAVFVNNFPSTQNVSVTNASLAVTGTFWQATQPVSIASTVAVTQSGTWNIGTLTSITNTVVIKADTAANQANMLKVDASGATVPVSGTFWQSTQPVSIATLPSLATGSNTIGSVKITDGTNTAAVLNSAPGSDTGQSAIAVRIISQLGAVGGSGTQYVNGVANASPTGTLSLGYDGANLRALKTDTGGILSVNFTNTTLAVTGTFWQATQPVSGTITANIGTTNGLALDATLTGGTAKYILRGGAKGSTTAADVTSVSIDANTQALHVSLTNTSVAVTGTFWQATQPVSIAGTVGTNIAQINGVTPLMGNGITGTGSLRVTIASDNTAFTVNAAQSGTWNVGLNAGSNIIGQIKLVDTAGTNVAKVGTNGGLYVSGAKVTTTSGNIAAAGTGTVGGLDVSEAGNVTFIVKNQVAANAYAGNPVLVFEQSDDNASWGPLVVVNSSTGQAASTFVLPPNTANGELMFDAATEGVNWVRVRVTTGPVTNPMTIVIQPGGLAFSPVVSVVNGNLRATYRASTAALLVAAAGTAPFFVLQGSSTKTIRVQRIIISGFTLTAVQYLQTNLAKYSTAASGGTATALTKTPLDSQFPASTANLCQGYTVAPTAGTKVGDISTHRNLAQATTAAAAGIPEEIVFDFRSLGDTYAPVLRGTAEGVGLYFPVAPASAVSMMLTVEWTEE